MASHTAVFEVRSSSAGGRRCTPPPRSVQELAEDRKRSYSACGFTKPSSAGDASAPTSRPSSPLPRVSTSVPSLRGLSPSREQFQSVVKTTYFGFESQYPNESDIQRRERAQLVKPPRLVDKPLDAKFTNYRGHIKCKHCSQFVPFAEVEDHLKEHCPLAPCACPLADTETGVPCGQRFRGRELLHEHLLRCPLRTRRCENRGCGKLVSVQSTSAHLQLCSFEPIRCPSCHIMHARSEVSNHAAVCSMTMVPCPLGCGESIRRSDVNAHIYNTLFLHKPRHVDPAIRAPEEPQSVIQTLLQRLVDMHDAAHRRVTSTSASVAHSRSATPMAAQYFAAAHHSQPLAVHLKSAADVSGEQHLVKAAVPFSTEGPPSTIQEDDERHITDISVDHSVDGTASLRQAIVATARSHHGEHEDNANCDTPSAAGHASSSVLFSSFRNQLHQRRKLGQPVQSVTFATLHEFLCHDVCWFKEALDGSVNHLQQAPSTALQRGASSEDMTELLRDVDSELHALQASVNALSARTNFENLSKSEGEAQQEHILHLWKGLDRVWYEWKLAMYEKIYLAE